MKRRWLLIKYRLLLFIDYLEKLNKIERVRRERLVVWRREKL